MKKIISIFQVLVIVILLVGCYSSKIDYEGIVQIEQSFAYSINEVPSDFYQFVVVDDEYQDQVINIEIDTGLVIFDEVGEYRIYVTIEYSDGEERIFDMYLIILDLVPADPIILGVKNLLIPLFTSEYDLEEHITYYDEGSVFDSGVLQDIDYYEEGYYPLSYYVTDNEGNNVTVEAFAIVGNFEDDIKNMMPRLYEMSDIQEDAFYEYSLLMYAAFFERAKCVSPIFINNLIQFIQTDQMEFLLDRELREDEILAFRIYQNTQIDQDILYFTKLLGRDLTEEETGYISLTYEIFHNYFNQVSLIDIDHQFISFASTYSSSGSEGISPLEYYIDTGITLTNEELAAIEFYVNHKYISDFFVDISQVIEYTEYQFDQRILDIDVDDSKYYYISREIDNLDVLQYDKDDIENSLGRLLNPDEELLYDLYRDYAKHYVIYKMIQKKEKEDISDVDFEKYDIALELLILAAQASEKGYEQLPIYNYQRINFMKYNSPSLVEEFIGRELTDEEYTALEYIENINEYKDEEYYDFIEEYTNIFGLDKIEVLDIMYQLIYEVELRNEYLIFNPFIMEYYEFEIVLERSLTEDEIIALDEFRIMYPMKMLEEYFNRYDFTDQELIDLCKVIVFDQSGELMDWDFEDTSANSFFEDNPEATEVHFRLFNTVRRFIIYSEIDYKYGNYPPYNVGLTDEQNNILRNAVDVFLEEDFTLSHFEYIIRHFDFVAFEEDYELSFTAEQQEIILQIDSNFDVNNEEFLNAVIIWMHMDGVYCDEECLEEVTVVYEYLGTNASSIISAYLNLENSELEEISGKEITDDVINAIAYINEIYELHSIYHQFHQHITMEEVKEHIDALRILIDFGINNYVDMESVILELNLAEYLGEIATLSSEEVNAAIEIERFITTKFNTTTLLILYNEYIKNDNSLFYDYIVVYEIFNNVGNRIIYDDLYIFPELDLTLEEQASYDMIVNHINISQVFEQYEVFYQNEYNTLTMEELYVVLNLLKYEGFDVTSPSFSTNYLTFFSGFDIWLAGFDGDTIILLETFIYELRQEEIADDLRATITLIHMLGTEDFDKLVDFVYELEEHNAFKTEVVEDIEIKLNRTLTEQEEHFLLILQLDSDYLIDIYLISHIYDIPLYELTEEIIEEYLPKVAILKNLDLVDRSIFLESGTFYLELQNERELTEDEKILIFELINPEIQRYLDQLEEARRLQGLPELTEIEKTQRYEDIKELLYYTSILDLVHLDFSAYNFFNSEQFDLAEYLDNNELLVDMSINSIIQRFGYVTSYENIISIDIYIRQIQYYLLYNNYEVLDLDYFSIEITSIIRTIEEFEQLLGRELTEVEVELVNEHNQNVAIRELNLLISAKEYRMFDFIPIVTKREIHALSNIYVEAYSRDFNLDDLLESEVAFEVLGRYLTEKEIEFITFLYS